MATKSIVSKNLEKLEEILDTYHKEDYHEIIFDIVLKYFHKEFEVGKIDDLPTSDTIDAIVEEIIQSLS